MNVSQNATQRSVPLELFANSYASLDELDDETLVRITRTEIEKMGGFDESIASRLDSLFNVKAVKLLRSPHTQREDLDRLDGLISRIARDKYAQALDASPLRFGARWSALRNLLAASARVSEFEEISRCANAQVEPTSAWEVVARMVVEAGSAGVPWADVPDALANANVGPKTKGGVSQLLTAMRAAVA